MLFPKYLSNMEKNQAKINSLQKQISPCPTVLNIYSYYVLKSY